MRTHITFEGDWHAEGGNVLRGALPLSFGKHLKKTKANRMGAHLLATEEKRQEGRRERKGGTGAPVYAGRFMDPKDDTNHPKKEQGEHSLPYCSLQELREGPRQRATADALSLEERTRSPPAPRLPTHVHG